MFLPSGDQAFLPDFNTGSEPGSATLRFGATNDEEYVERRFNQQAAKAEWEARANDAAEVPEEHHRTMESIAADLAGIEELSHAAGHAIWMTFRNLLYKTSCKMQAS